MQCICTISCTCMFHSFSRCWLSLRRCVLRSTWVLSPSEQSHHRTRRSVAVVYMYNKSIHDQIFSLVYVYLLVECTLHRIFFRCAIVVRAPTPSLTTLAMSASTANSHLSSLSYHLVGQPSHHRLLIISNA